MTQHPDHPTPDETRYAVIELVDGGVLIYDADNHQAWIQCDCGVTLAEAV